MGDNSALSPDRRRAFLSAPAFAGCSGLAVGSEGGHGKWSEKAPARRPFRAPQARAGIARLSHASGRLFARPRGGEDRARAVTVRAFNQRPLLSAASVGTLLRAVAQTGRTAGHETRPATAQAGAVSSGGPSPAPGRRRYASCSAARRSSPSDLQNGPKGRLRWEKATTGPRSRGGSRERPAGQGARRAAPPRATARPARRVARRQRARARPRSPGPPARLRTWRRSRPR